MTHHATPKCTVVSRTRKLKLSLSILAAVLAAGFITSEAAAVTVNAGVTVSYAGDQTFSSLVMRGGDLYWSDEGFSTMNVLNSATLSSGRIILPYGGLPLPLLHFQSGAVIDGVGSDGLFRTMRISANVYDSFGLTVWNSGNFIQRGQGELELYGETVFVNRPGATYDIQNNRDVVYGSFQIDPGATLLKSGGGIGTSEINGMLTNSGTIRATQGTLLLREWSGTRPGTHTGATISTPPPLGMPWDPKVILSGRQFFNNVTTEGNVALDVGAELINQGLWQNSGRFTDGGPGGLIVFDPAGSLANLPGGDLSIDGQLAVSGTITNDLGGRITVSGGISAPEDTTATIGNSGDFVINSAAYVMMKDFTNLDGTLVVNGTLDNVPGGGRTRLLGGILSGGGTINGQLFVGGGPGIAQFKPGNSPGTMTINGDFSLLPNGILELEVESDGVGGVLFDRLVSDLGGSVFLDGRIDFIIGAGVDESDVAGLSFFDSFGGVTYGSNFTWDFPGHPGLSLVAGPEGLQITPEPATLSVLALGGLAMLRRRK